MIIIYSKDFWVSINIGNFQFIIIFLYYITELGFQYFSVALSVSIYLDIEIFQYLYQYRIFLILYTFGI